MDSIDILEDVARRPLDEAEALRPQLAPELLNVHPGHDNSVAWLLWHSAREIDEQLSALSGQAPVWTAQGFKERFALDLADHEMGLGHTGEQARQIRVDDPALLLEHLLAVVDAQLTYLESCSPANLSEVIDDQWDPPVTRGARLVSMSLDAVAHVAQAAYIAGMKTCGFIHREEESPAPRGFHPMIRSRPFAQVDVFSPEPFRGNPVAVILDAEGMDDETMQRVARWTNLSETTFVLPATADDADYRLRIFTPTGELPFAGHPTLGSARAWLEHGGTPRTPGRLLQECAAGIIEIRQDGDMLAFAAPPLVRTGALDKDYLAHIVTAFNISPDQVIGHQWVDNGPGWAVIQLATAEEVLALDPDFSRLSETMVGAIGAYPDGSPHAFEVRAFAPAANIPEDPVTGSLNASVAQWLSSTGQAPDRYTVSQGTRLDRAGEVSISVETNTVWVGGATTVRIRGTALA